MTDEKQDEKKQAPQLKLWEVKVEVVAYVVAPDDKTARDKGWDACKDEYHNLWRDDVAARQVTNRRWVDYGLWDDDSLVYGTEKDMTLREALEQLVPEGK